MRILKIHQPINLGEKIGVIGKGEYKLADDKDDINKAGYIDSALLKHWFVKKMLDAGLAVIIVKEDAAEEKPAKKPAKKQDAKPAKKQAKPPEQEDDIKEGE